MMKRIYSSGARIFNRHNISSDSIRCFSLNSRDHAFNLLGLRSFTEPEIQVSYRKLQEVATAAGDDDVNTTENKTEAKTLVDIEKGIQCLAEKDNSMRLDEKALNKVTELVIGKPRTLNDVSPAVMTLAQYRKKILELGEKLDPRVWNIGLSFLFTGTSVGIIIPCMPLLVSELSIPASEFGLVVSAFGLSKLLGNIPSGYFVEKWGRKPSMVFGLGMCGVGLGALGLALQPGFGTPWLIACRLVSGLGVSGFVAGGYMFMSDISTPLNRTRTIAPVMAGFSGGAALGPALGGVLIDSIGISATYATVGGMFLALAGMNGLLLHETKNFIPSAAATLPPQAATTITANSSSNGSGSSTVLSDSADETNTTATTISTAPATTAESNWTGVVNSFHEAFAAWRLLLNDPNTQIRNTVRMNGMFWFTVSGTQMTLLPLLMVGPRTLDTATTAASVGLAMSAAEIGGCFAFMSLVSFVSAQPMAYLADKYGKVPTILGGCGLLSCSMLALPLTTSAQAASFALPALPLLPVLPDYTPALVAVLLPFALGNTALNATPTALMSDLTEPSVRAQALSLLRTSGDLGLLLGASFAGALAHYSSLDAALATNGALTAAAMFWFAAKNRQIFRSFAHTPGVNTSAKL